MKNNVRLKMIKGKHIKTIEISFKYIKFLNKQYTPNSHRQQSESEEGVQTKEKIERKLIAYGKMKITTKI